MALSVAAGIPAAYALARFNFPMKNALAFVLMSFRFVPFIAFVIPLYLLYQRLGLYNTHAGLIFAYQLITLPFTIWMLRSFFRRSRWKSRKRRRSTAVPGSVFSPG